jgi:hypothetical protein
VAAAAVAPPAEEKSDSRCFIASAAWGSPYVAEVRTLRRFRDEILLPHALGRRFVDFYYRVSPPIAAIVADTPLLKQLVRTLLWPVARLASLVTSAEAMERRPSAPPKPAVSQEELLVRFRRDVPAAEITALLAEEKCEVVERLVLEDAVVYRVRLPGGVTAAETIARLSRRPGVVAAEPNRRIEIRPPAASGR